MYARVHQTNLRCSPPQKLSFVRGSQVTTPRLLTASLSAWERELSDSFYLTIASSRGAAYNGVEPLHSCKVEGQRDDHDLLRRGRVPYITNNAHSSARYPVSGTTGPDTKNTHSLVRPTQLPLAAVFHLRSLPKLRAMMLQILDDVL